MNNIDIKPLSVIQLNSQYKIQLKVSSKTQQSIPPMNNAYILQTIIDNYHRLKQNPDFSPITKSITLLKNILISLTEYLIFYPSQQSLYISFNGGKDSTVALFLLYLAINQLKISYTIKCLYFEQSHPFQQIQQFIISMQSLLNLSIIHFTSKQYQIQLTNYNKVHKISYIIMGLRKDDPGCSTLNQLANSDIQKGYPNFIRVNPLIQWSYHFLWNVIKQLQLPYCNLYNHGYTSLGNLSNTSKNQSLKNVITNQYLPAYHASSLEERKNRICN